MKVLHLTAHLGGGVGRVLSRVAQLRRKSGSDIKDIFLCLEPPEKGQFIDALHECDYLLFTIYNKFSLNTKS